MKSSPSIATIPELGFQVCSYKTVRAIRFDGDELLWQRTIGDLSTAVAVIDSFRRDTEGRGLVSVENEDGDTAVLKVGAQLIELFDRAG